MQDILNNFGVNWFLVTAQIVNFLIILWLLKRFAYKPIFQMLEKRKKQIAEGVANAEKTEEVLKKTLEQEKEILKKAHLQSQQILTDAQQQAQETMTTAEQNAKVRVATMLADGVKEIQQQTEEAQQQLSRHTVSLAVELLKKSLSGMVDKKAEKEIVEKVAKKLHA